MKKEIWKDIKGYDGYYQVSNFGRIKSFKFSVSGVILKYGDDGRGYSNISLYKNEVGKTRKVHRLVAKAFLKNFFMKPHINHKNGVKIDNRVSNLEWCTMSENQLHSYRILKRVPALKGLFGKKNHLSKKVVQKTLDGDIIRIWDSIMDADREGFENRRISDCCGGKRGMHKGFLWEYL